MSNPVYTKRQDESCPMCGETMVDMQACHTICPRCGAQLDCTDM